MASAGELVIKVDADRAIQQLRQLIATLDAGARPLEERIHDALTGAGFDETDAGNATAAVMAVLKPTTTEAVS